MIVKLEIMEGSVLGAVVMTVSVINLCLCVCVCVYVCSSVHV